jgi:5-formyltetrahydrofolate cyclo-ligase
VRRAIGAAEAEAAARAAAVRLGEAPEFGRSGRVALYAAVRGELSTRPLFDAILAAGKPALLPALDPGSRRLTFRPVRAWEELRRGELGVPEPPGGVAEPLGPDDLIVVPGLAFDRCGNRLGSGAGWYDRTFPPGADGGPMLVGYGYEVQIVTEVPHGTGDRAMELVVTEAATHRR